MVALKNQQKGKSGGATVLIAQNRKYKSRCNFLVDLGFHLMIFSSPSWINGKDMPASDILWHYCFGICTKFMVP